MNRYIHGLLVAAVAIMLPAVCLASHYDMGSSGIVDDAMVTRMSAAGIVTTEDLWNRTVRSGDRSRLARRLRVAVSEVSRWHDFCDLLRLDGVGPKVARIMTVAGVRNLKELARQSPDEMVGKIRAVWSQVPELGRLPESENYRAWIEQAKALLQADQAGTRGGKPRR